ncbi:unnamed protein product [Prunus armeniaca]
MLAKIGFPEGLLSSEQGVYIAESVAAKNMKQAKGHFRMYEDATIKEGLQRRRHVSYNLGRRHPYVRGSEKYRKIYLPY